MTLSLRHKLVQRNRLIGSIVTLPSPEVAEILSRSGFDWLFVDLEHSALSVKDAQSILQAVASQTPCVVRVPSNEEVWIKKCLDIGADGLMVPQIRTPSDARRAVQLCKYPPMGERSVGIARAQGYGARFQEYVAAANDGIAVILQIEHVDAVANIEEILGVDGIDCLFVGPYDLSASMGKIGRVGDDDVRQAIARVKGCADRAAVATGIFGATPKAVQPYINDGYSLIAVGIDTMLIGESAKNFAATLKGDAGAGM